LGYIISSRLACATYPDPFSIKTKITTKISRYILETINRKFSTEKNLSRELIHLHFTDEETEVQRGKHS
jgi:hypothetical protein